VRERRRKEGKNKEKTSEELDHHSQHKLIIIKIDISGRKRKGGRGGGMETQNCDH